ncbi:hypothetical protein ACSMX9_15445 [Streptomyces sp. LE64]|uniref:hypothetical protein n=1 Tax=Streptomyces sp. LE64 TaxID=3448653 RepID=UPI00404147B5
MTNLISPLISALGALTSTALLVYAVRDHSSEESVLWIVGAAVLFLVNGYVLVRDVWRLRSGSTD